MRTSCQNFYNINNRKISFLIIPFSPYLFVISSQKNGDTPAKVKLCAVEQGILVDNKVEITKGLIAGDEIVVKGQNLLNDDASVNIVSVQE